MNVQNDGLSGLHADVLRQIDELGLVCFPGGLSFGSRTSSSILAFWPEDGDWRKFLAVAAKAGCAVIYTSLDELTADEIADLREEMGELA